MIHFYTEPGIYEIFCYTMLFTMTHNSIIQLLLNVVCTVYNNFVFSLLINLTL